MSELAKLRFSSTFVVWAARMLRLGEKVVWYHHWALDRSKVGQSNGDHCYMSSDSMAERLGLSKYTIEEYRTALRKLELLQPFRRAGATNLGWVANLPAECEPKTDEIAGPAAVRLAAALDLHVRQKIEWLVQRLNDHGKSMWDPEDLSDRLANARRILVRKRSVSAPETLATGVLGRGVRGEGTPPSLHAIEDQLPPAVNDGVGAIAPELEDGGPELTLTERRALAEKEEREAEAVRRAGWQKIRDALKQRAGGRGT